MYMNIRYSSAFNVFVLVYISVEVSVLQAFVVNVYYDGDRAAVSSQYSLQVSLSHAWHNTWKLSDTVHKLWPVVGCMLLHDKDHLHINVLNEIMVRFCTHFFKQCEVIYVIFCVKITLCNKFSFLLNSAHTGDCKDVTWVTCMQRCCGHSHCGCPDTQKNSGWGIRHPTILIYLVTCNWLPNCNF